jgi:hypothetical protein
MKAIFRKHLYYEHMMHIKDKESIELYKNLEGEPEWVDELDGHELGRYEIEATEDFKESFGIETIFIVNRYTDLAEWTGRVILHPAWFERTL